MRLPADVDGTLTAPRKVVTPEMREFIAELRKKVTVGVVGGSDLAKAKEQLGEDYVDIVDWYRNCSQILAEIFQCCLQ